MPFENRTLYCDLCVVGGGLAGIGAAVTAARCGVKVILVHDRPMLGGNASSEIKMWVSGAQGEGNRESGLLEEIELKNFYRNPYKNYSIWDSILWETVHNEKNITLLLNTTCFNGKMSGAKIESIECWQMTTQRYITIKAPLFADTSGDSVLAPISNAEYMQGRENRQRWNESFGPCSPDSCTMGNSILISLTEHDSERVFIPPEWAEDVSGYINDHRIPNLHDMSENFWYLELGGDRDTISDAEDIRDDLMALAYGFADWIKNDSSMKEKSRNFDVSWIGALPGKRESRRYIGDYIMTEKDLTIDTEKSDVVAYGGWPMDDHHPEGFRYTGAPNINHTSHSPYHIPYRSLYSKNVENLLFAGRNISVSHAAFSSTRVMATCICVGQAVGIASYLAMKHKCKPRQVGEYYIKDLQGMLQNADCWLPGLERASSPLLESASFNISDDQREILLNGIERDLNGCRNSIALSFSDYLSCTFEMPLGEKQLRLVFDSDLDRRTVPQDGLFRNMGMNILSSYQPIFVPRTLIKDFDIVLFDVAGQKHCVEIRNNAKRLVIIPISFPDIIKIELHPISSWGMAEVRLFSFDILEGSKSN